MELRQVRYFVAVAEELHFGRAAARLHMAEQPLGQQVRKLEEELGFKLLERTTRHVALTPAGESFLGDARKLLDQVDRAADTARRIAQGEAGVVRLGYEAATVLSIMPDFVKLFRAEYPEIDLVLVEHSKAGLASLSEGVTDACLVTRYQRLPRWVEYLPVLDDMAVIALPEGHPLAEREELSLADMEGLPFLGYAGLESGSANLFLQMLASNSNMAQGVDQEAETYMALLGLVAAGLGFTIVNGAMNELFAGRVAFRPMVDPAVPVSYGLALREGEDMPTAHALRTVARHLVRIV